MVEDPQEAQVEDAYKDAEGNARRAFLDDYQHPLRNSPDTHQVSPPS